MVTSIHYLISEFSNQHPELDAALVIYTEECKNQLLTKEDQARLFPGEESQICQSNRNGLCNMNTMIE